MVESVIEPYQALYSFGSRTLSGWCVRIRDRASMVLSLFSGRLRAQCPRLLDFLSEKEAKNMPVIFLILDTLKRLLRLRAA